MNIHKMRLDRNTFIQSLKTKIVFKDGKPVNPWKSEIWRVYRGSVPIYIKEKTLEDCLLKYGIAELKEYSIDINNKPNAGILDFPYGITGIEDLIEKDRQLVRWRCPISNKKHWQYLTSLYRGSSISLQNLAEYSIFKNTKNIEVEYLDLSFKFKKRCNPNISSLFENAGTIENLNINFDGIVFDGKLFSLGSWKNWTKRSNVKNIIISYNNKLVTELAKQDISKLTNIYPSSLEGFLQENTTIENMAGLNFNNVTHIANFADNATSLKILSNIKGDTKTSYTPWFKSSYTMNHSDVIFIMEGRDKDTPGFGYNRQNRYNLIKDPEGDVVKYHNASNAFCNAQSLEYVLPTLNFNYAECIPYQIFRWSAIKHIYIYGLSNILPIIDFTADSPGQINLPNIDSESLLFLIKNTKSLHTTDPNVEKVHYQGGVLKISRAMFDNLIKFIKVHESNLSNIYNTTPFELYKTIFKKLYGKDWVLNVEGKTLDLGKPSSKLSNNFLPITGDGGLTTSYMNGGFFEGPSSKQAFSNEEGNGIHYIKCVTCNSNKKSDIRYLRFNLNDLGLEEGVGYAFRLEVVRKYSDRVFNTKYHYNEATDNDDSTIKKHSLKSGFSHHFVEHIFEYHESEDQGTYIDLWCDSKDEDWELEIKNMWLAVALGVNPEDTYKEVYGCNSNYGYQLIEENNNLHKISTGGYSILL